MAEHPYMPLWTDAYMADTRHLSTEEHGAYLLLLMCAWRSPACTLPDDDNRLARMAGLGTKKWARIRPVLEQLFTVSDGQWTQKRLLKERKRIDISINQKRQAANAKWRKENETQDAGAYAEPAPPHLEPDPEPYTAPNGASAPSAPDPPSSPSPAEQKPPPPDLSLPPFLDRRPGTDLKARVFGEGLDWLAAATGREAKNLRPMVGRWCRDYGDEAVLAVMCRASRDSPVEPVAWIEGSLKARVKHGKSNRTEDEDRRAILAGLGLQRAG